MLSKITNFAGRHPHLVTVLTFLFFLIATAIAARPVLSDLDSVIIGDDPDVYINPWADWWTLRAWQDPELELWQTDYIFFPEGANLTYHSFSHLNTLVSLALRPFLGALPAYNLMVLLNLILVGFSMYQLARYLTRQLTGSYIAAVLAGIVFAFNTNSLYQVVHPVLLSVWCFPWATLYFLRAVRENQMKWAVVSAVFIFLGAATSTLLIILLAMWFAFLTLYLFLASEPPRPSWKIVLTIAGLSSLLILPLVYPLLREVILNRNSTFLINDYLSFSTDITALFIPHWLRWTTRGIYLGIVTSCLALVALIHKRREARLWFLLVIVAFLFMIGPEPAFDQQSLGITLPWSAAVAPLLRSMYRVTILMAFGYAMVVAYGWSALAARLKGQRLRAAAAVICVLAIYIDFTISTTKATPVTVSSFYSDYLDAVPDDVALAILPTGRQVDKLHLFYQTIHGHKITGGVISRSSLEVFDFIYGNPLLRAGATDIDPVPIPRNITAALRELAAHRIGYLVLDKTLMSNENAWRARMPGQPVFEDNFLLVYATTAAGTSSSPPISGVWHKESW